MANFLTKSYLLTQLKNFKSIILDNAYLKNDAKYTDLSDTWTGTKAEFEAAKTAGTIKDGDYVNITDDGVTSNLAAVATSGSYNDLTNKPTIPSSVTESTVSGWGFTKNTGTYSKPSGGIPKTDLASSVQTSLGKADTALQSFTETDPTVQSYAKTGSGITVAKSVPSDALFTDHTYSTFVKSGSSAAEGLVPKPSTTAGTKKFLREDATWVQPPASSVTVTSGTYGGSSSTTNLQTAVSNLSSGKASVDHASTGTTYGTGNATNYGHVKLVDTYSDSTVKSTGKAEKGVAASAAALYYCYNTLNGNFSWKDLGDVEWNVAINLPSNYNELSITVYHTTNHYYRSSVTLTKYAVDRLVTGTGMSVYPLGSLYVSSNNYYFSQVVITNSTVSINSVVSQAGEMRQDCRLAVAYR